MTVVVPGEPASPTTASTGIGPAADLDAGQSPQVRSSATARSLTTVAVVTAVAVLAVTLGPPAVAVPAGILLATVLPGTALTWAVFRRRSLSTTERVVLAPALSLALVVLSGLLLHTADVRLDRGSWAAALAAVTAIALLIAAVSIRADQQQTTEPTADPAPVPPAAGARWGLQLLPLVVAAAVLGGAGWYSYTDARTSATRTVTAMSVTRQVPGAADRRAVEISLTGLVPADGPYRVVARNQDGRPAQTATVPTGSRSWTGTLTVSTVERITIELYRAGQPTIAYRTVLLSPQS